MKPRALAYLQEQGAVIESINPDVDYVQSMLVGGETEGSSLQITAYPSVRRLSYRLQVLEASDFY